MMRRSMIRQMSRRKIRQSYSFFASVGAVVMLGCLSIPALAAEEAAQNPAEAPLGEVFRWLNFAVVFGGLAYLIAKKAPPFFQKRAAAIFAAIREAAAAKAEAERMLRDAEENLVRLPEEISSLRAAAKREASSESERMHHLTLADIEKIERAARAEVQASERAARVELSAIGARLAVQRAEVLLAKQMTRQTQAALFQNFVAKLRGAAN